MGPLRKIFNILKEHFLEAGRDANQIIFLYGLNLQWLFHIIFNFSVGWALSEFTGIIEQLQGMKISSHVLFVHELSPVKL